MLTFSAADYDLVTTKHALTKWRKRLEKARSYCIDSETTGLDALAEDLVGIALSVEEGSKIVSAYIPVGHWSNLGKQLDTKYVLNELSAEFAGPKPKLFHNALYDMQIFGQGRYSVHFHNVHDSMLMAYVLFGDQLPSQGMDYLAKKFLAFDTIAFKDVVTNRPGRTDFRDVPLQEACEYAAEDTAVTLALGKVFQQALKDQGLWEVYNRDRQLLPVIYGMKKAGVKVDVEKLRKLDVEWQPKLDEMVARAQELKNETYKEIKSGACGLLMDHTCHGPERDAAEQYVTEAEAMLSRPFNLGSPLQVKKVLQARGLDLPTDRDGKVTTDKAALERLEGTDELVDILVQHRKLSKLKSSFVDALPRKVRQDTGRVHPEHKITRTVTGRLACANPNTQQIPSRTKEGKAVREAFVAEDGYTLVVCDESQIELRVAAHVTEDPVLVQAYVEDKDIHALTAANIGHIDLKEVTDEARGVAKTANFLVVYGGKARRLAQQAKIDYEDATDFLLDHERTLSRFYDWKDEAVAQARKDGCVFTLFGRRVPLPHINSRNSELRSHAERLAISGIIQGSAADLIRLAMVSVHKMCLDNPKWDARLILSVHDELIVECKTEYAVECAKQMKHLMETAADNLIKWRVPIKSSSGIGPNWREAK